MIEWVLWIAHALGAPQVEVASYPTEQECRTAAWKINAEAMQALGKEPPLNPAEAPLNFGCVQKENGQ